MKLSIRRIEEQDYRAVHSFQCQYLDWETFSDFASRVNGNPDLYLAGFVDGELAGICYGHPWPKDDSIANLQGIAVNLDLTKNLARRGIGSQLLGEFEQAVRNRGFRKIGVGSADDGKVEHFYLKNGFQPIELVAKDTESSELERVSVDDYESGNLVREELRRKHNAKEVIFIFEKCL
jgi:GNAT superfamily N-acetyltransferase